MPDGAKPSGEKLWQKEIKLDLKVAIAGVLASLLSIVVTIVIAWFSLSSSPEEDLVKLGYRNSPDELWHAASDRNLKAVTVFAQTATPLPARVFQILFDDAHFDAAIVDALTKGKNIPESECPTQIEQLSFYSKAAVDPEKASRVRRLCGKASVVARISAVRQIEAERLNNAFARNASRPARLVACRQRYEGDQRIFDDAVKLDVFSVATLSERECVLAQVKTDFLVGDTRVMTDRGQTLRAHIDECCSSHDPLGDTSSAALQLADQALKLLSP